MFPNIFFNLLAQYTIWKDATYTWDIAVFVPLVEFEYCLEK
jgi:hypothetical protein